MNKLEDFNNWSKMKGEKAWWTKERSNNFKKFSIEN